MGSQSDPSPHPAPISTSAATNMPAESNPYVSPAPVQSSSVKNEMESVKDVLGKWGKKAADDTKKAKEIAENMWQHWYSIFEYSNFTGIRMSGNRIPVVIPLHQLRAVNPSASKANPAEKYIQVISVDNHEFWFMGFVHYDNAVKNLQGSVLIGPNVPKPTDPLVGPKPDREGDVVSCTNGQARPGQVSLSVFIFNWQPDRGKHTPIFMADDITLISWGMHSIFSHFLANLNANRPSPK
ncbi:GEM-like protein 1 [Hibiscus syriacus]|uniref:GEM-like protein 1 n=1 Tax=Hibiscus syriacus TaxID=106335 RepID=A0A6A2XAW2_HIBSY|nr:GEM-like protein 1 [Hibiscus syriacus]